MLALLLVLQLPSRVEPWSVVEALSPDGKTIALGVNDGSLRCIDLGSGKERFRARNLSWALEGISWSRDGHRVAAIAREGDITVLDASDGAHKAAFDRFLGDATESGAPFVHSIDFVDGDSKLLSRSGASKGRLLDAATGTVIREISYGTGSAMTASAVSADGKRFALGNTRGEFAVHSAVTGEVEAGIFQVPGHVNALAFDPHGARIAVGASGTKVRVFTVAAGAAPLELVHDGRREDVWVPSIGSVCFSPDGRTLLSSTCDDSYEVRCWDLEHSTVLWKYEYRFGTEFPAPAAFSKAGDLAVLCVDGIVLNSKTGETAGTLGTQPSEGNVKFSTTGDKAWVCSKGEVRVYDVRDGKLVCEISLGAAETGR